MFSLLGEFGGLPKGFFNPAVPTKNFLSRLLILRESKIKINEIKREVPCSFMSSRTF